MLNEGDMLFRNCTFDSNMNMLHVLQRSKPTGGNIGAEQDVCAFGATAQVNPLAFNHADIKLRRNFAIIKAKEGAEKRNATKASEKSAVKLK